MSDEQAGFRKDRSTVQQILMLRLIAEKAKRKHKRVYTTVLWISRRHSTPLGMT